MTTLETKNTKTLTRQNKPSWMETTKAKAEKQSVSHMFNTVPNERKKGAKMNLLLHNKQDNPNADLVKWRLRQDAGALKLIILEGVDDNVKREIKGMEPHEMWTFIEGWNKNEEFRVIDQCHADFSAILLSTCEDVLGYLSKKRMAFLELQAKDSELITESHFLRQVLQGLEGKYTNEVHDLYKELRSEDGVTWDHVKTRLEAAHAYQNHGAKDAKRPSGGDKTGQAEENTNTALITQLLKRQAKLENALYTKEVNGNGRGRGGGGRWKERRGGPKKEKGDCYKFEEHGTCAYGARCRFLHDGREPTEDDKPSQRRKVKSKRTKRRRSDTSDDDEEEANHAAVTRSKRKTSARRKRDYYGHDHDEALVHTIATEEEKSNDTCSWFAVLLTTIFVLLGTLAAWIVGTHGTKTTSADLPKIMPSSSARLGVWMLIVGLSFYFMFPLAMLPELAKVEVALATKVSPWRSKEAKRTVVDGGCTTHLVTSQYLRDLMYNVTPSNEIIKMNSHKEHIVCRGSIDMPIKCDRTGETVYVPMHNVAWVPTSIHNLFSVTAYLDQYFEEYGSEAEVTHHRKNTTVTLPGGETFSGPRMGDLFYIVLPDTGDDSGGDHEAANSTMDR